jgi:hypothetical protein
MSSPNILPLFFAFLCAGIMFAMLAIARRRSHRLLHQSVEEDIATDRESFSDYYRPMRRLLDQRELNDVRSLPYISAADFRRFRAGRISAFQAYLRNMRLDFNRVEFKLRYMVLAGTASDAHLVLNLNQMKTRFHRELLRVQWQLLLFRIGFTAIEIGALIEMLEQCDAALTPRTAMAAGRR